MQLAQENATFPLITNSLTPEWGKMLPESIEPSIEYAIQSAQSALETIENIPENAVQYENTLGAFDSATEILENAWTKVLHLDAVANHPDLRKAIEKMLPKVTNFLTEVYLNKKLYHRLKIFSTSQEAKTLSQTQKRFLEETLLDFVENGAQLDNHSKKTFQELNNRLAQLTQKYTENVLDATNQWELIIKDQKSLAGLPESAKTAAFEDALDKGYGSKEHPQYRFTLHQPSFGALMQYLEDDSLRKKTWLASQEIASKAPYENTPLIQEALSTRKKIAQLLGYPNFAELITKRRMVTSAAKALEFIHDLHQRIEKKFNEEAKALAAFKAQHQTQTHKEEKLEPWEVSYWAEKQRQELLQFDEEALRPYFEINSVLEGLFKISEQLFNLKIKEKNEVMGWHTDVKYYEIFDASTKQLMGAFYADWHPRKTKRSGAWMNPLLTSSKNSPGLGIICGNLTKPTKEKPALLTHNEVCTIFHEFGHLLHHVLGTVEIKSLNGISVPFDFVELPSQLLENWCWERDSLNLFAKHFKTQEPLPDTLFEKLKKTRSYLAALAMMRQLSLSKMDLELHMHFDPSMQDLDRFIETVTKPYTLNFKTKPKSIIRQFLHLFSDPHGYAAGYYSYKWSEVLDADVFSRFQKEGIFNQKLGVELRHTILSQGNSKTPHALYMAFMGREPQLEPLLKRFNLI